MFKNKDNELGGGMSALTLIQGGMWTIGIGNMGAGSEKSGEAGKPGQHGQ